jgi:hypothetical protein
MATTRYVSHLYEVGPIRLRNFITDIQHLMGAATDRYGQTSPRAARNPSNLPQSPTQAVPSRDDHADRDISLADLNVSHPLIAATFIGFL